jgi:hypothetical protein
MLHLHNGDSAANIARQTPLPGEHVAWRESLITGPTPSGLSGDEWLNVRSKHLAEAYGVDPSKCRNDLLKQQQVLESFADHEEVILWFEHDLFCQLHMLYLLAWFSRRDLGETKLTLICIGEFPGKENFRGLGELTPAELASLFPKRQPVTPIELSLAASTWQAFCSAAPTQIKEFLKRDVSALPFLGAALRAHLQRFPSTKNGLGRIEESALQLVQRGADRFGSLFASFSDTEAIYGFGDAQLWNTLRRMATVTHPLITMTNSAGEDLAQQLLTPAVAQDAKLELTHEGGAVLNGDADFVATNGIDQWLGGVHLLGAVASWRWDEQTSSLEFKL